MSTLKVTNINNAAASSGGIAVDTDGHVQVDGLQIPSNGTLSNRNLIINGDMRIAQRGTAAVTGSNDYILDRWLSNFSTGGAVSLQQSTAVTPDGFGYSLACTVTTADATTNAAEQWNVQQYIEGYNIEQLLFGTANAKDVTVSFWVRSSVTGTYCVTLLGSSNGSTLNRSRVSEYTINSANTWEYKTITVPGDTGGTWTTDNGRGLSVRFGLTAGTNFQQATGSWDATNVVGSSSQTQLLETLNATWYVTGVQLEVGTVATPFEHKSYGQELALCQRYYFSIFEGSTFGANYSTSNSMHMVTHPVTMRDTPSSFTYTQNGGGSFNANYLSKARTQAYYTGTSGTSSISNIEVSAEL
jgi:hypothetical protein